MLQTESSFPSILKNKYFILVAVMALALAVGMAGLLDPVVLLGAVAMLYLVMMLFKSADFTVLFVMFVIYSNTAVVLTKFHGVPPAVGYALPLLLLIPFIRQIIVENQKIKINVVFVFMVLYFSVMLLGSAFASDIALTMPALINFVVEGLGLYFLIINTIRTPKLLNQVVWSLLIAGAFMGGLSLYQQITGNFTDPYWGFAQVTGRPFTTQETLQGAVSQYKVAGPIGEQNRYAQLMLVLVPLGLFRAWGEQSWKLRLAAFILTGLIFVGASLAFSRGAMVGFLLMIVVMAFMRYIKMRQVLVIFLGIALLLVAFPQNNVRFSSLGALFSTQEEGGLRTADGSIQGRATEMLVALLVFWDHPVFGVGPGMLGYEMAEYSRIVGLKNIVTTRESHSMYLGEAAEHGALGIFTLMLIFFYTLHRLAKARTYWLEKDQMNMANLCTGFFLAVIGYMTTAMFLHMSYIRYLWLIMALAVVASEFTEADVAEDLPEQNPKETPLFAKNVA